MAVVTVSISAEDPGDVGDMVVERQMDIGGPGFEKTFMEGDHGVGGRSGVVRRGVHEPNRCVYYLVEVLIGDELRFVGDRTDKGAGKESGVLDEQLERHVTAIGATADVYPVRVYVGIPADELPEEAHEGPVVDVILLAPCCFA